MSFPIAVPAGVPSLAHNSTPSDGRDRGKKTGPPAGVSGHWPEPEFQEQEEQAFITHLVPAVVPSLAQRSSVRPTLSYTRKNRVSPAATRRTGPGNVLANARTGTVPVAVPSVRQRTPPLSSWPAKNTAPFRPT